MIRTVLLTGSEGHLGRALRARFEGLGDRVVGVDLPRSGAEIEVDLDTAISSWLGLPVLFQQEWRGNAAGA